MPRFFFNIHDGVSVPDTEGAVLEGWRAAQIEAVRLAGALLADNPVRLRPNAEWALEVVDEGGLVLFRIDVELTGAPALAQATNSDDQSF